MLYPQEMLLNKAMRGSFSSDGILLSSAPLGVVVVWGGGKQRGGCYSSDGILLSPVLSQFVLPGKNLIGFFKGTKLREDLLLCSRYTKSSK